ncbi:hypothetical protein LVD13_09300 [Flavobacteriaceae bacterium D16]|nr:hypothetical protein [Flavobacteriaceae bacterium D16]
MNRKESFWFIGTVGLVLVLTLVLFGLDGFKSDSTFDINIYDTYFVFANIHIVPLLIVFAFFTVYLLRVIRLNFRNFTVNVILIIATILLILILGRTISMLDFLDKPINDAEFIEDKNPVAVALNNLSSILFIIQTGLLVLLAYCGFKTGQITMQKNKH